MQDESNQATSTQRTRSGLVPALLAGHCTWWLGKGKYRKFVSFFFSPRLVYVGRRVARIAQVEAAKTWPKFKVEPDYWEQDSIQNFRWIRYPRLDPADSEIAWIKTLVTNCHFAYVGVCWSSSGSSRADRSSKVGQSSRLPLRSLYQAFFFWQLIETFKRLFIFLFYYI